MQTNGSPVRASGHLETRPTRREGDVYYVKFRVGGRQFMRKLGPVWKGKGRPPEGFFTRKKARDKLAEILTDARRGALSDLVATTNGVTFGQAADEWLRYVRDDRKRRPSTVRDYERVLDVHLRPAFGDRAIETITTTEIDALRARLVAGGRHAARTVNKILVVAHGVFRRAQRSHGLAMNPVVGVERQPLRRSGKFDVLSPVEVEALARAADTEQDAALYAVAAFTGLRLGELRALRWNAIDFDKRLVHVRASYTSGHEDTPKSGRVRSVPLIDQAARALDGLSRRERFTDPDDLVFPGFDGGYCDDSALRRRFKDALTRAGLKRICFHDLRHSFGTLAVQAFPLSDVRAYMGHADIGTTMTYVHFVPQHDAADRLSKLVTLATSPALEGMAA